MGDWLGDREDYALGEKVVVKLRTVMDPETFPDVTSMGLIKDLEVEDGKVSLKFRPTVPTCPMGVRISRSIKEAVESGPGVKELEITVIDHVDADTLNESLRKNTLTTSS